eukprot:gene6784-7886_t
MSPKLPRQPSAESPPSTCPSSPPLLSSPVNRFKSLSICNFDPIVSLDSGNGSSNTSRSSIIECIQQSFYEQRSSSQRVLLNNIIDRQKFSATMQVEPFNDGCSCVFTEVANVHNNTTPITPSTSIIDNQRKLLLCKYTSLQKMLKNTPIIVWRADSSGTLQQFERMDNQDIEQCGGSANICRGRTLCDLLAWVHPKQRHELKERFTKMYVDQKEFEVRYFGLTTCNTYIPCVFRAVPIKDDTGQIAGWIGISFSFLQNEGSIFGGDDISVPSVITRLGEFDNRPFSERTKLRDSTELSGESFTKLQDSKKFEMSEEDLSSFIKCRETFYMLFKLSFIGVMFTSLKGTVLDANDTFLSIIGYSRTEMEEGKIDWMMLTPPEFYEITARAINELAVKRWCQPIEKAYINKKGNRVPVRISSVMINGSEDQCVTFVFDISRHRAAEEIAVVTNKMKSQFIANISHELRTPCHGIMGMIQLLQSDSMPESQRETVQSIKKSADILISLIEDILDFSKIETGKTALEIEEFDLTKLIEDIVTLYGDDATSKSVDVVTLIGLKVPAVLYGDAKHLRQILSILVSNAIKFTDKGYVQILVTTNYEGGDQVSLNFSVEDSGIGIAASKLEQLVKFEPFCQIDGSMSRKHGGSGLGLSKCKQMVDLMGGSIEVTSILGHGSTFSFSLQFLLASPDYLPTHVPAVNQHFYPEFRKLHQIGTKNFSLILMDCQMPEMDGFACAKAIRELEPKGQRIPIIAMTANNLCSLNDQCVSVGMDDYLAKPVKIELLRSTLSKWISPKGKVSTLNSN